MSYSISLCRKRAAFLSKGIPIVVAIWLAVLYASASFWGDWFLMLFSVGVGVGFTALTFLVQFWSVAIAFRLNMSSVSSVESATHVVVWPPRHKGRAGFARITRNSEGIFFEYLQKRFVWNEDRFVKVSYPSQLTVGEYVDSKGIQGEEKLQKLSHYFGSNSVTLPEPSFQALYKEHALAPFFVLQVFFVLLWCLDEYWMYALLTGVMLGLMEALTVWKRLKTIRFLRSVVQSAGQISVLRNNKWVTLSANDLVPGDVFEVQSKMVPCDAVVISGSCVVNEATLTGENVALLKDSCAELERDIRLSMNQHRSNVLFGGTHLMQSSGGGAGKVKAVALRTGFASSQGKVLRTIAFASETVSANSVEALFFILFLLCFAVAAASYVLRAGLADPDKSRYKLLLECIIILTSVVPPELPIELALAVTTSLAALKAIRIFCTEPFRIPFAGKLDVCAFDKTGTLTRDDLLFKGMVASTQQPELETAHKAMPELGLLVVAGCQSLSRLDGKTVGDPLESSAFDACGFNLNGDRSVSHNGRGMLVSVLHRFHFNSALRRMTSLAAFSSRGKVAEYHVCVKGAPEAIKLLLRPEEQTEQYDLAYRSFANRGFRVIALASKLYSRVAIEDKSALKREELEENLSFQGFLVFECPLRPNTTDVLSQLSDAGMKNIMITGDSELTACAVALDTNMSKNVPLILTFDPVTKKFTWRAETSNPVSILELELHKIDELTKKYMLCVTGSALDALLNLKKDVRRLYPAVTVWARCSPANKEAVMIGLKSYGCHVLMCGDGTNDVGALKQSHVGVALVYDETKPPTPEPVAPTPVPGVKKAAPPVKKATPPPAPLVIEKVTGILAVDRFLAAVDQQDRSDQNMTMGDASIAAPFTVRGTNVAPVLDIIRQGRCTLVTTMQMYFILALNCLVTAYSLSVVHLHGVRYSDSQMTMTALLTTICFLFISRALPLKTLAARKPKAKIFSAYFMCSLLLQFAVHLGCLIYTVHIAETWTPNYVHVKKDTFEPSVLNTCVFLISASMSVSTFLVNYQGHPFMQSLSENRPLRMTLLAGYAVLMLAAAGLLNPAVGLTPLHPSVRGGVVGLILADLVGCFIAEKFASLLFSKFNTFVVA